MPDLNALVIFASVVEGQSFSSAARRLKMPLSTVSRRIAELEADLGGRLLERNSRRLRMTPLGSEVYAQAKISVDVSEAVASLASDHEHAVSGVIRISSPPNLSDSLLMPLVDAFLERHPGVRIAVFITGRSVDFVEEGVDVGFFVERQFREALVHQRILRYRHLLVATPQYVAEHGDPRDPEELVANHRIYAFSFWNGWEGWNLTNVRTGEERTLDFQPTVAINDFAGISSGLLAGRGIGDLPPIVQPALVADGKLREVMCEWRFPSIISISPISVTGSRRERYVRSRNLRPSSFRCFFPICRRESAGCDGRSRNRDWTGLVITSPSDTRHTIAIATYVKP